MSSWNLQFIGENLGKQITSGWNAGCDEVCKFPIICIFISFSWLLASAFVNVLCILALTKVSLNFITKDNTDYSNKTYLLELYDGWNLIHYCTHW